MIVVIQRRVSPLIAGLIALTLVTSIVAAIDARHGGELYARLALVPQLVWHGEVWRLLTWPFVQGGAFALLFTCLAYYWFGTDLLATWGFARFSRFVAAVVAVAGVGTCLIALVLPTAWWYPQLAGMALCDGILIAWGLQFPDRPVRIYLILLVNGRVLAYGLLALTVLFGVFYGFAWILPELLGGIVALLYLNPPRWRWWQKLKAYRARRKLGVIRGDRHGGPYQSN